MVKRVFLAVLLPGVLALTVGVVLAQAAPSEERIAQAIIVNGQQVQGITVTQDGSVQSYTCAAPKQYTAVDQSSSGWACYDQNTGTWLMHAVPQQSTTVYQQAPVYYPNDSGVYGG